MAAQARSSETNGSSKTTPPRGTATTLTWLDEMADGYRDEGLKLVMHAKDGLSLRRASYTLDPTLETEVCRIQTPSSQPTRQKVQSVTLDTQNGASHRIDVTTDDLESGFGMESAIEKFVYPYYHSHRSWTPELEALKEAYRSYPDAFAMRHKAPSRLAAEPFAESLEVGVIGMGVVPQWYSPKEFIELVSASRSPKAGGVLEAAGRGPGTR